MKTTCARNARHPAALANPSDCAPFLAPTAVTAVRALISTLALVLIALSTAAFVAPGAQAETNGCTPDQIERLHTQWRVKQVRNEWDTVNDLLRPLVAHYDDGSQNRRRKTENCLDLGALAHRIPYAIGKTAAVDAYAHDRELLKLESDLRQQATTLSMYCMDDGDDAEARAALDAVAAGLPLLQARLKAPSLR